MSSGRLPLDSSYRKLIEQRHLRDTARTKIQASVAWAKLNANWIRGKGFGVRWGGGGGEGGFELNKSKKRDNISG